MSAMRPELSTRNKYYVEKHRYYELKHFCLQYTIWKRLYSEITLLGGQDYNTFNTRNNSNNHADPTSRLAEQRLTYYDRIKLVEKIAMEADPELATYILKGVTEELSFNNLKSKLEIPCCKDTYYDRYRRFFWLLDKSRD